MSPDKKREQSCEDIYNEKYERESEILFTRLFKTDCFFKLDGFLLKRYIDVLIKLTGYRQLENFNPAGGCRIDKNGYSLEVAEFLGRTDYLFMPPAAYYSIIISPEQENIRHAYLPFSFIEECSNHIYKKYREIIKYITKDEAAVIEYKFNVRDFNDISKIHRLKNVTLSIDTIDGRIAEITKLQKLAAGLGEDDNLLSDAYVSELIDCIQKNGKGIKNILNKLFTDNITIALHSFYLQLPHTLIVLFDSANKNTLLFYYPEASETAPDKTDGFYPISITSENIINNLESLKFIDYHTNPLFIQQQAETLEDLFLLENGYDLNRMSKFEISRTKSELHQAMPGIINSLYELKGLMEQPESKTKKYISRINITARYILAYAKTEFDIVNKLLCIFDKHNYLRRYYSDTARLEKEIASMTPAHKYYILKRLEREIKRSDITDD